MKTNINYIYFDMYSKKIGFYYNNHEKISSFFGFFLTILYILASLILFLYELILAFQRKNLKVYDTNIYSQEMPIIDIDIDQLYFAFGLEYPNSANRYIDESIYTVDITFLDRRKVNDEFITVNQQKLEIEKCKVENFGKNYQNLFVKDELNNSYCLKNFNYSLTLAGSYKYERITYIRIVIYPCVNSTKNNFSCKPQEEIDKKLNSGYFSIVLKDFGLNPSNFSYPRIPTLQDLYTTIDRRLNKNYILNYGITEIHTDTGLINGNYIKEKYLQFRKVLETFSLRDEKDYHSGKNLILVQLRLEDTLFIQKRAYTKISEIFSTIGGYMQLMNTVFLLVASLINNINSEIKIINSIFNFNINENKMILKCTSLKDSYKNINLKYNNLMFSSIRPRNNLTIESGNKSKNNLIIKENDFHNISSINNISDNKGMNDSQNYITINKYKNKNKNFAFDYSKNGSINSGIAKFQNRDINKYPNKVKFQNFYSDINNIDEIKYLKFNDHINLNIFDYFCSSKKSKKCKHIKSYNKGNTFYRKQLDIVHVFTILSLIEDIIKKQ